METDKKFIKGFNAGYLIAKHNPQLSNTLKRGVQENESPTFQGFLLGTRKYEKEKYKEGIKKDLASKVNDTTRDKEHER